MKILIVKLNVMMYIIAYLLHNRRNLGVRHGQMDYEALLKFDILKPDYQLIMKCYTRMIVYDRS